MSRQPPTVTSASTSSAAPWAFTQVPGPVDSTLLVGNGIRCAETDARPALAQRSGMLSARDRLERNRFLIRGRHP